MTDVVNNNQVGFDLEQEETISKVAFLQVLDQQSWYHYLPQELQESVDDLQKLVQELYYSWSVPKISDYSFLVMIFAKVYEGFLKHYLLDLKLINLDIFYNKRFSLGRAINPDVKSMHKDEKWLFDDLVQQCGITTARLIWQAWLVGRNQVVHYFPAHNNTLSLYQAIEKLNLINQAMQLSFECYLEQSNNHS